jgi:hypothetical protein
MDELTAALRREPVRSRIVIATLISSPIAWGVFSLLSQMPISLPSPFGYLWFVATVAAAASVPVPFTQWLKIEYTYVYAVWFVLFLVVQIAQTLSR